MTTFVGLPYSWGTDNVTMTDAVFRQRISPIHDAIVGCGLVQTADTGQIDFATITVGVSANVDRGYAIYRFNDSRQGVDPLFIKVFYGVGTSNGKIRLRIQTGTGSNGSGTLTGQLSTVLTVGDNQSTSGSNYSVQNYSCHVDGYFFMAIGVGNNAQASPLHYYALERSRDASYAFDAVANIAYGCAGASAGVGEIQCTRTASPAATYNFFSDFCLIPGYPADTALLNGDKQLYPHWYNDPQVKQCWSHFSVRQNEFPANVTSFSATPITLGGARTFIWLGGAGGWAPVGDHLSGGTWKSAFLWE